MSNKSMVWAVDILAGDISLQKKTAKLVKGLSLKLAAKVIPTYVLTPAPFIFHPSMDVEDGQRYRAEKSNLKQRLEKWTKGLGIKSIGQCEVLLSDDPSVRSQAEELMRFASETSADLIVLSTNARKGMERFFLGSFAETLVLRSSIPLMLVQPNTKLESTIKYIVFPTDFSAKSRSALAQVEPLAKITKARIELFNHMEYMTPSFRDMSLPRTRLLKLIKEMWSAMKKERQELGEEWVNDLKSRGISAKFTLDEKPMYTVDAILAFAKKFKSAIVAVSSQTKPGLAEIIGGVARRVVRQAQMPVWVVHPVEPPLPLISTVRTQPELQQ